MNSSAGILPISRNDGGEIVFLIGKDSRDNVFSDFGGKSERIDNGDPVNTATREFYEETLGCICNNPHDIRFRVKNMSVLLMGETKNKNQYRMFVVNVPFMKHINSQFMKVMNFMRYKNIGTNLIEKSELVWVTFDELFRIPKRKVFEDTLMSNYSMLYRMVTEDWKTLCDEISFETQRSPTSSPDSKYIPPSRYRKLSPDTYQ
ncbi:hypothetical protein PBCVNY2B_462L [Paramecium bursaria Chlorella virus NY2B]|uniref:Nudix hydrolase domain-containing protein n=1 Tax=Paramecium bursaria Chlorella virus NYs1 TaxID=83442 RepID=M1I3B2_9PHYC|nr:hypothetical protein AR158_C404L [Paramecium bursaria Chlorella virus AR158]YP_009665392.1 hypothetical protein FK949_gp182 [Paramecium bursaria Chlorella virus NYs1]AGE54248.1 hypothetical protein PBCVIL52s1_481L [Paramecium bursaria Chlorella virus IL-5-2s1]AGE54888.1 hypothetical protein PBCVMA1D_344L [Paramecium bursaria Chlorella virus MA1D]AGE58363.1 hypothetical protein PBCVNY2B_462L [Paramecium bursaria Chlorella virus NY2B]ABU43949.1 hypothetical protein AR158_C404L [Paramecium bur